MAQPSSSMFEQDDFILPIGEEHIYRLITVLILFMIFVLRLLQMAERQTTVFGRVYGYGVAFSCSTCRQRG